MMVKVCGITRREDALAAAEAGASALGFIFYPKSPRYVTASLAASLGEGLDVLKVGVFVDESSSDVETIMREARLDVAQIYGSATPAKTRVWRALRYEVAKLIPSPTTAPATPAEPCAPAGRWTFSADALLLDGPANGISFDWKIAFDPTCKIILAGGLDASNVAEAIRIAQPWGVDASSKLESAPGIKDHQKMRAFIKAAQDAK